MLTLFSTCKPFRGEANTIQQAAFQNWSLIDDIDVIIFGEGYGVEGNAWHHGFRHVPDIACNKDGVPFIEAMFHTAEAMSYYNILAYTNCDILFHGLPGAVEVVATKLAEFLIVGQRHDFAGVPPTDFADGWQNILRARSRLHAICGVDYFVFTRELWPSIPAFVVGYPSFDNWLVADALKRGKNVVDATGMITAFHPDHTERYSGATEQGVKNRELATKDYGLASGFTKCAQWTLNDNVLTRKNRR